MRKKIIVLGFCIILATGTLATRIGHFRAGTDSVSSDMEKMQYEYYYNEKNNKEKDVAFGKSLSADEKKEYIKVDTDPDSYTVLVNRDHLLSKDYIPADLVVPDIPFSFSGTYEKSYMRRVPAKALEKLFAGALKKNYRLIGVSAYRSYERQDQIYRNNVRNKGEEKANQVSAFPGSSEHQTGLSIDVSCSSINCALEEAFGRTPEGKWLKKNCYKYGFIIRYPHWRERVTGYSYEPWHIRYVGKNLAKYLYQKNLTLEEYYQLTTVDEQVKSDPISDMDMEIENEPEMTAAPTPRATAVPTAAAEYTPASKAAAPTEKSTVSQTAVPKDTEMPDVSDEPVSDTEEPARTEVPKATKKPEATEKVAATKKPVVTEAPAESSQPEPSAEPVDSPEDENKE